MAPGLIAFVALVIGFAARAWALGRLRRGDHRAASLFVISTLALCASTLGIAIWTAVRIPVIGVPTTVAVLVVSGVWLRQAVAAARIASGNRGPHGMLDRTVGASSDAVRIAASAAVGAGFVGAVVLILYLLFRSRF